MLRLLEHYASPQGEGPKVGIMSQFVRFAGCNLKCPGWPCDTPHAINPKLFKDEQVMIDPFTLANHILNVWKDTGAGNVVFTGGEPLIQNQDDLLQAMFEVISLQRAISFEVFTNGTQPINRQLIDACTFVLDWKLPSSGEATIDETRINNIKLLSTQPGNAVKFVVSDEDDLSIALALWKGHLEGRHIEVYVGAAWDRFKDTDIVEFVKVHQLPWRLNVQVQNYIFGAHKRFT